MSCTTRSPFQQILYEMGQDVVVHNITRTVDADGNVTAVTTTDVDTTAMVQEVGYKEKLYIQMGIVNLGDIMFFFDPATVLNVYDKITYEGANYSVRKILQPPRIHQQMPFKQAFTVKDTTE